MISLIVLLILAILILSLQESTCKGQAFVVAFFALVGTCVQLREVKVRQGCFSNTHHLSIKGVINNVVAGEEPEMLH